VNLLKSKLRRTTAVVAGAILGLGGVAFLASPASAHHSVVQGTPTCDTATGDWVVQWEVNAIGGKYNGKDSTAFRLNFAEATPTALAAPDATHNLVVTTDDKFPFPTGTVLKAEQRVASTETTATLKVKTAWDNGFTKTDPDSGTVTFEGTCAKTPPASPKPEAHLGFSCENAIVTLTNGPDATKDADFTVKGSNGFVKNVTVAAGAKPATVEIPAKDAESIKVYEKNSGDKALLTGKYEQPKDCEETPVDNADRGYEVTCDKLIFSIDNTKGTETVTVKFTPNKGEAKTLEVKGGKTGSVEFTGEKGLTVTPSEKGQDYDAIKWDSEKKPADCTKSPEAPAPGNGGGESLPLTGAATGGIAAGAAVLLAVGGVLFFMARRRKVKFTA